MRQTPASLTLKENGFNPTAAPHCRDTSTFSHLKFSSSFLMVVRCSIDKVIQAGIAHGCKSEDLYGCLYFYLSDQLNTFIERVRQVNVTFYLFAKDCQELAKEQKNGKLAGFGLPASQKYDRIDVSNTVDDNYVGFRKMLESWGPLLNEQNPSSTLLSYSMNWVASQPGAAPDSDRKGAVELLRKADEISGLVMSSPDTKRLDLSSHLTVEVSQWPHREGDV